ncbi:hypothetical protein DYB31_004718 [Aphanomyces astaci]|uniref:ORC6 second cyclin-like domain-containing protein n=1 Tax=Aphanomyces astaci TaxID=112090 RepID=A0A397FDS4_APHAT|nr:hypothetical protein DYB31_004718 [Aphanomyces astaci]
MQPGESKALLVKAPSQRASSVPLVRQMSDFAESTNQANVNKHVEAVLATVGADPADKLTSSFVYTLLVLAITVPFFLGPLLVYFKVDNVVSWSWWLVLLPLWVFNAVWLYSTCFFKGIDPVDREDHFDDSQDVTRVQDGATEGSTTDVVEVTAPVEPKPENRVYVLPWLSALIPLTNKVACSFNVFLVLMYILTEVFICLKLEGSITWHWAALMTPYYLVSLMQGNCAAFANVAQVPLGVFAAVKFSIANASSLDDDPQKPPSAAWPVVAALASLMLAVATFSPFLLLMYKLNWGDLATIVVFAPYFGVLLVACISGGNAVPMLDRPAACLELACEVLQEPFDSRKLYMLSGGTSLGKHKQCVRNISGILRLQTTTTITTASLCVKFGCPGLKDYVASVHDEYKHRMMAKLTATQQRYVDVTRPLFPAAVFYTCAQKASNQLLQLTMSQPKEFGSVVSSIEVFSTHATLCSTDDYLEGIVSTCTDQSIVQHLNQANDAEELAYTLKRLIRGLASSRDAARQGFSTALTALLHHFPAAVPVESVLDLLKSTMDVSASMKGMEQRDHMFGRLFGLLAIHSSGRLSGADDSVIASLLDEVIALSKWKKWFREACYEGLLAIVESLPAATFESVALPKLTALLSTSSVAQFNADQVSLAIGLHTYVHAHNLGGGAALDAIATIVSRHHFHHLVDPLKSSTSIYPRLHSSWRRLVEHFTSTAKLDEERFQEMWSVLVEGMLVAPGSSHERRGTALKLFEALVPTLPPPTLRSILTPHFIKVIHNNAVSKKTYLHEAALGALHTFVSAQPLEFFRFLQHQFLHPLTCLVSHLPDDDDDNIGDDKNKKVGFEALLALEEDKERADFQAKRIASARMWALDTMYTATLKLPAASTSDQVWKESLGFFVTHAFFEPSSDVKPSKKKKKAGSSTLDQVPTPALSASVVAALSKRVYALVGLGNQVLKDPSVALDTSVPFRLWQTWGDLTNDGQLVLKVPLSTAHAAQRTAVGKQLKSLVAQVASAAEDKKAALRLKGFTLLNVCVGLQLLDPAQRDDASSVLADLARCLAELNAPAPSKKKAKKATKEAETEHEQQPLAVLTDMLLSMLAQGSSVMRDIVTHVFRSIMEQLDAASVQSMVDVVVSSADEETSMLDMDEVDDDDDDGAPIDPSKLTTTTSTTTSVDDEDVDHVMEDDDDENETIHLADLQREDAALSAMVSQVSEKKKAKQHAKRLRIAALHFKVRVLDLLHVYAGSPGAAHVINTIEPLFKAWTALKPHRDTLVWSDRVGAVLQKIARRTKEAASFETDAVVGALAAVLAVASGTVVDKKQAAVAASLVTYLVRTGLQNSSGDAVAAALVPSISTLLTKKHAKLPRVVLDHLVTNAPALAGALLFDTLAALAIDDAAAADDFARAEVVRHLTALFKTKGAVPVSGLAATGPALQAALVDALGKVKGKRLKGVANCAQALLKARVDAKDESIDAIALAKELKALLVVQGGGGEEDKKEGGGAVSPVLKGMVAQMLQVLAGPNSSKNGDKKKSKAEKKRKRTEAAEAPTSQE